MRAGITQFSSSHRGAEEDAFAAVINHHITWAVFEYKKKTLTAMIRYYLRHSMFSIIPREEHRSIWVFIMAVQGQHHWQSFKQLLIHTIHKILLHSQQYSWSHASGDCSVDCHCSEMSIKNLAATLSQPHGNMPMCIGTNWTANIRIENSKDFADVQMPTSH